jgi:hypothetical protein
VDLDPLSFSCPRCHTEVAEPFYGPCTTCRVQLRATLGNEAHALETVAFDPKMNVVPNAVASKD